MKFYQKKHNLSIWITIFILAAAVIIFEKILTGIPGILSVLFQIVSILRPFIIGFIIAFILYIPCKKFEALYSKIQKPAIFKKHIRGLSVLTVYILGVAVITIVLVLVIPWLVNNIIDLYNDRTRYYNIVVDFINDKSGKDGKIFGLDTTPIIEMINPDRYISNINLDHLNSIANGVYKFGSAIIDAVLAIFSSVYMLSSRETLIRSVGRFFTLFSGKKKVLGFYNYLCKISGIFYSYIYSALLDALLVAIICTLAFTVIGVDYAPLFGFAVGISNLIPYFGAIISGICVSVFTAVTDGLIPGIIVAASILVIQQIDCNILQPKIVGQTVGIQPLYTLIAITLGGGIFGIWGIILGVPIAATLQMIVGDILNFHDKKVKNATAVDDDTANSDKK